MVINKNSFTTKHEFFESFNVSSVNGNAYVFFHISIGDKDNFYQRLFEYFFDENKLIQYIDNQKGIRFSPTKVQYATLYKHLKNYIDSENIELQIPMINDEDCLTSLSEEMPINIENNKITVRLDKFGKIGEYFFNILLSRYFNFDCIIPKVHFTSDNNMNVYGIDTLFYSTKDDLLMFGESKFCIKLQNGINLINRSLIDYEHQIAEEFRLILSGGFKKQCAEIFNAKFGDLRDECLNIQEFIERANIKNIGVPIFIAHGTELDEEYILERLNHINKHTFFGLNTLFYYISLPVINKNDLMNVFVSCINKKLEYYSNEARKL